MGKILVFFTRQFPYGVTETFIENEMPFLSKAFEKVFIVCTALNNTKYQSKRELPDNCVVIDCFSINIFNWKVLPVLYSLITYCFPDKDWEDIQSHEKTNAINKLYYGVVKCRSILRVKKIGRKLRKHLSVQNDLIFYSYWFDDTAYIASQIRNRYFTSEIKLISRAHRMDLYDLDGIFKPLRSLAIKEVDRTFACSNDGQLYLINKFPKYADKIATSYLGTKNYGLNCDKHSNTFNIVSCSYIKPVKRIELILEALSKINNNNIQIEWIHYGDGDNNSEKLSKLAQNMLPPNITACFYGEIRNVDLMNEYKNKHFDLFINVSESEGLPVSIMEAISFGIPVVATDVGGTKEIVNKQTGFLIDKDFKIDYLSSLIEGLAMTPEVLDKLRLSSRLYWQDHFSAQTNYQEMVDILGGQYEQ